MVATGQACLKGKGKGKGKEKDAQWAFRLGQIPGMVLDPNGHDIFLGVLLAVSR